MIEKLKSSLKYWYLFVIAGLIFITGGILTFTFPLASYLTVAMAFAYFFVIEGISEVIFSIVNRKKIKGWGWTLVYGLTSIVIGVVLIINPEISASTMPLYYGFLFLVKSMIGVTIGASIQKETGFGSGLIAIGVIGVILSTILMVNPLFAGFTILFTTGVVLIASGVYSIALGVEYRKIKKEASLYEEKELADKEVATEEKEKQEEEKTASEVS
ncbi:HdeD family acid-resistance protein [Flammeovirga sp. OC4]|uniref:HdeD family acid-resistance protein n=1 Tax=Flammeovirga sp. OC4 TaxID=1382345 RepID=UPI0005C51469|nr:DUF308 domain-containing protein [Flammeovirga sp. OC4]